MIDILYHDEYIAVAVKPAGLLSEGQTEKDCFPAMLSKALEELRGRHVSVYTVHRLDRETEGIMVYALSSSAAATLSRDITEGKWQKIYNARLCGTPEAECGRLCDLLYYDRQKSKSFVVKAKRKGVKEAALTYKVISNGPQGTVVEIALETGRTHQIRVQFASRGMPLCGDRRYGAPAESGKTPALCACKLSFPHPKTREDLNFEILPTNL